MKHTAALVAALLILAVVLLSSCNPWGADVSDGQLSNGGFEEGLQFWKADDGATVGQQASSGNGSLRLEGNGKQQSVVQKIKNIQSGYYYLQALALADGEQQYCYLYGKGSNQSQQMTSLPIAVSNTWRTVTVRGIEVQEDGLLEVGICMEGEGVVYLDDITLHRETNQDAQYVPLLGGAISWLDWEEDLGAKYYDFDGTQKDALQIMQENGCNFVRLELYNNPGQYVDSEGNYFPAGYKDSDAIFRLAQRAHKLGMEIQLSFMYADYWGNEAIPVNWLNIVEGLDFDSAVDKLADLLYTFTRNFMQRLANAGIFPKYVSLGNEMDPGILLPYGSSYNDQGAAALAKFLNKGYNAVKEISPSSQVVLHVGCNADDMHWENQSGVGTWFFGLMQQLNVNYDVIGTSFYPFWAQTDSVYAVKKKLDLQDFQDWCHLMIQQFDKDILVMETGYNWGTPGQLSNNGAYQNVYPSTPEGQRNYMYDMINAVKSVQDGRCVGCLYWDPVLVRQEGIGYALYDNGKVRPNVVETTTFFDYDHKALPVLNAFNYN